MGEKLDALETFHPDRMASRILGMGDVLSLIEKAQTSINLEQAQEMEKKLRKESFTLDDFLDQLQQVRKLGPLDQILGMLPGMGNLKKLKDVEFDEKELKRVEAVIQSMTKKERRDPSLINGSRRKRIASGSGTKVQDVNRLLKQFAEARKMMKKFQEMQKSGKKPGGFKLPFMR
jgi:signal recognition particle subunit SRP54